MAPRRRTNTYTFMGMNPHKQKKNNRKELRSELNTGKPLSIKTAIYIKSFLSWYLYTTYLSITHNKDDIQYN